LQYESKIPYKIYPDFKVFTSYAIQDITFDDLHNHVLELMSDVYFSAGVNGIYDFSKITSLTGDLDRWRMLAEGMSSDEVIVAKAKTAIVLPEDNLSLHQIMEGYLIMTAGSLIDYQIFTPPQWQEAMEHVGLGIFKDMQDFEKKAAVQ